MADSTLKRVWLNQMHSVLSEYTRIPEGEWMKAQELLHVLKIRKGDYFIRVGDEPDKLAFIVAGLFRVFFTTKTGDEKILVFRAENRLLSAYSSFLESTTSKFSIQAVEESVLLYLSLEDYAKLLAEHSCWQTISAKYAELLFIEKEQRENEFLSEDAETRYYNFILHYPDFENRLNQYHIASYIGITPVALSRIRNKKPT